MSFEEIFNYFRLTHFDKLGNAYNLQFSIFRFSNCYSLAILSLIFLRELLPRFREVNLTHSNRLSGIVVRRQ
jgi:hypothetical protein